MRLNSLIFAKQFSIECRRPTWNQMWFAAATPEPKVSLDMASHWPDELRIEFAASVVPHFRKFDFQEGAPYPVTDPDEYTRERPVAMRIAGAGIPGNVIMYLRLVYQKSDSGTEICAYGNARPIQANGVLRIRAEAREMRSGPNNSARVRQGTVPPPRRSAAK